MLCERIIARMAVALVRHSATNHSKWLKRSKTKTVGINCPAFDLPCFGFLGVVQPSFVVLMLHILPEAQNLLCPIWGLSEGGLRLWMAPSPIHLLSGDTKYTSFKHAIGMTKHTFTQENQNNSFLFAPHVIINTQITLWLAPSSRAKQPYERIRH